MDRDDGTDTWRGSERLYLFTRPCERIRPFEDYRIGLLVAEGRKTGRTARYQ